jgi:uncharacterized protein (DUF1697 family)
MAEFAAFLRGINVGGHKPVPMKELKKAFESLRFKNVQTLLASGNVIFEAPSASLTALEQTVEAKLKNTFGQEIRVLIRSREELQQLSDSQPFKKINITPQTRLYVTFLSDKPGTHLKIPYTSPDNNFKILRASEREVCSVVALSPHTRTVELMSILEKEYGRNITTRNWNTIIRVLKSQQD